MLEIKLKEEYDEWLRKILIEDFGIPLNRDAHDFIQSFRFLSEMS
jgi:hypothetical protein